MYRPSDEHEDESRDDCEGRNPGSIAEHVVTENPDGGTAYVSAYQRPGLRSWSPR
jgi:hypothetical protein